NFEFKVRKSSHSLKRVKKLKRQTRKQTEIQVSNDQKNDNGINVFDSFEVAQREKEEKLSSNDFKYNSKQILDIKRSKDFMRNTILNQDFIDKQVSGLNDEQMSEFNEENDQSADEQMVEYNEKSHEHNLSDTRKAFIEIEENRMKNEKEKIYDSDDEELKEWENQQILKGMNNFTNFGLENSNGHGNVGTSTKSELPVFASNVSLNSIKAIVCTIRDKIDNDLKRANDSITDFKKQIEEYSKDLFDSGKNQENVNSNVDWDTKYYFFQKMQQLCIKVDTFIENNNAVLTEIKKKKIVMLNDLSKMRKSILKNQFIKYFKSTSTLSLQDILLASKKELESSSNFTSE
ncbi:MAG: hypothetical protein MHPSP_001137, partial [Paramarteilia canceri]